MKQKIKELYKKWIGEKDYIESRYRRMYGHGRFDNEVNNIQKSNKEKYLMIGLLIVVLIGAGVFDYINGQKGLHQDANGQVYSIDNDNGKNIYSFKVNIIENGKKYSKNVQINLKNDEESSIDLETPMTKEAEMDLKIDQIVRSVNASEDDKVSLPSKLENGSIITWEHRQDTNISIYLVMIILILVGLYRTRYVNLDKEEKLAILSVKKELPIFINKIVLLLNAGMVFYNAFMKIVDDNEKFTKGNNNYFYQQLNFIAANVKERNYALHTELENFAKRTRLKEFVRVTSIISDNIYKGVTLTDKLEKEGEQLWFDHKKQIEEKGKLAETKLVAPLALLLVVLVMITVAPAMIEM